MKVERGKFRHMNGAELRLRGYTPLSDGSLRHVSGVKFVREGNVVKTIEATIDKFVEWHRTIDNGDDWQEELKLIYSVAKCHLMADPK